MNIFKDQEIIFLFKQNIFFNFFYKFYYYFYFNKKKYKMINKNNL